MGLAGSSSLAIFLGVSSLVVLFFVVASGRRSRLDVRLDDLEGTGRPVPERDPMAQFAHTTLPRMGIALLPDDEEKRTRLQTQLVQAGLYGRQAMLAFLGVKMLLIVSPALLGVAAGVLGLLPIQTGGLYGTLLSVVGIVGPGFWLSRRRTKRQRSFRRALPDALDVLVICLEGGLSLPAAVRRMASELRTAHPLLAFELNIVQREVQMGRSTGEALRQFGVRVDLEEIRSLAAVIIQAERFGASLVKALRVHAETLRLKRMQYAEEMAQKAATKILFPTLLCIFPGVFIVVLTPAVIQIMETLGRMQQQ